MNHISYIIPYTTHPKWLFCRVSELVLNFYMFLFLGSGFSLSLILNTEQYEYISGSDNDVGVKVRICHGFYLQR